MLWCVPPGCMPARTAVQRIGMQTATAWCIVAAQIAMAELMFALWRPLQALVRWGGALLELAHLKQGSASTDMIQQVSDGGGESQGRSGPGPDTGYSMLCPSPPTRPSSSCSRLRRSTQIALMLTGASAMPTPQW